MNNKAINAVISTEPLSLFLRKLLIPKVVYRNNCFMYLVILSKMSFYAVKVGRSPGVYRSWEDCAKQVHKYPKAVYKKFSTMSGATTFIDRPSYSYRKTKTILPHLCSASSSSLHSSSYEHLPSASMIRSECSGASAHPEPIPKSKVAPKKREMIPDPPPVPGCSAFVYTDGSCLSNGVRGEARAGMGVYWGEESEYNISRKLEDGEQTNARAELLAIEIALEQGIHKVIINTMDNTVFPFHLT